VTLSARELDYLEQLEAEASRRRRARAGLRYVPHDLHARQMEFLSLSCTEAMYGGAAGGGKTDALLAAALRWVDVPGYAALLLRRTYPALALPNAIMDRARQWLGPTDAVWDGDRKQWRFPSGAVLQFGYCDAPGDLDRYQSAEFQFIGVDELTEWPEQWYRFLFSRLRRPHGLDVSVRMRAATNPGGLGQEWVREHFGIPENAIVERPIGLGTDTVFMPARVEDNPSLDLVTYEEALKRLGAQKFEQLRWGRWTRDAQGMVYHSFDRARNCIQALPALQGAQQWTKVLALDFGVVDQNGITMLCWRDHDPVTYVRFSYRFTGGPSAVGREVLPIYEREKVSKVVGDVGGMGKAYEEEFRKRFHVPVHAAKKHDKLGNISLLNSALEDGQLLIVEPDCKDLIDEYKKLPWVVGAEGKREAPGFNNHCCDSALYGFREASAFGNRPKEERHLTPAQLASEQTKAFWEREERDLLRRQAEERDTGGAGDVFGNAADREQWGDGFDA
jgi:hypothetical protein